MGQNKGDEGDLYFALAFEIALSHRYLVALIRVVGDSAFRLAAKGCPGESIQLLSAMQSLQEKMNFRPTPGFAARVREHLRAGSLAWKGNVRPPLADRAVHTPRSPHSRSARAYKPPLKNYLILSRICFCPGSFSPFQSRLSRVANTLNAEHAKLLMPG